MKIQKRFFSIDNLIGVNPREHKVCWINDVELFCPWNRLSPACLFDQDVDACIKILVECLSMVVVECLLLFWLLYNF